MAEQLLFITVDRIVEALCSPAAKEIGLLWGVQDDLQNLTNTVSTIKAVLLDAEEKQAAGSRAVKNWLGKLEDAIYDADDLLDAISTDALRREIMTLHKKPNKVRILFSKSNQLANRLKMARKIKAIRKRLDAINADRRFLLEVRQVEETRVGTRERDNTHSFVRAEAVIGRDNDRKAVIHHLLDSNVEDNVSILPIVGIGGLGKTTLAQFVFNDHQIQKHFELKMWVCVSDTFHIKSIAEKILETATNTKQPTFEMSTLVNYLRKEIDGNKYFLVLDDVWNEDHENWSHLKELLMGGARGSRILVTTRNESVARITGTVESYSLRGLDEDASWSLFKQMAFEKGQEPENSSIIAIGREILEKCYGVPLAIRTIGSLLGSQNPETEWLSFKNKELSKISQKENGILPTLKLSYDHLSSELKHCFAYCSLFPKDYWIDKSTLIQLWIAQGFFMSSDQNRNLEDVGHEYFMDLLWRSFFQEAKTDEFSNVIKCKMHDLMHDLAVSVAGSLITTLDDKEKNIDEKTRHVSMGYQINSSSGLPTLLYKASRTRTFLRLGHDFGAEIDCDATFSSLKFLRVLDLHKSKNHNIRLHNLNSIGKLKHLRYLDLSRNHNIKRLPNSITRLQNLQTLRLYGCESLKELPRDINKLVNLRHLEIDGCYGLTYMPCGLGQLTNLQTLSTFVVHSSQSDRGGLQELNGLNNLSGKLVIENLRHGKGVASECKAANLKEKQHLHALHLLWSYEGHVKDSDVVEDEMSLEGFQPHSNLKQFFLIYYRGSRLPSWILSLTNLVTFELSFCEKCQYLPPLSHMPSLKYLSLDTMDGMQYISDSNELSSSSSAPILIFPSLKEIWLSACPNLKGWWRRDSSLEANSDSDNSIEITKHCLLPSFPRLSTLSIKNCPMFTSMPLFPHLEEELALDHASSKPLQQTMIMNMAALESPTSTAAASSSTPLSELKSMTLESIADLETLQLQSLTSLVSLTIYDCSRLKSLSPGIQYLTALQYLDLQNCLELELANDEEGMQWQGLMSLISLHFFKLQKLVSLPSGLQHVTTLQTLVISHCESLTTIPEWIHNCISLQVLVICRCLSLASLPEGMRRLTSLQRLTIECCPILLQRCERDIGEDWPKIAHIPELDLQ
jgi:Leucine-rich repeat (LRR) protein